ncbi:MAG: N-formylglutamate amidohydrolase [Methyloceanibacter sp.]|uniref:N-formylglutamate amidohydrolase n=1 Tax=Methyloceanibacter sp. TaxID=1965321 RepID=UPI003EDF469E
MENPDAAGQFVVVCDHASNRIPDDYKRFGFDPEALKTHIAWDRGALGVARHLMRSLDAPLIWPDVSRLVIDCNRPPDSATLIVTESEGRPVPANHGLSDDERCRRLAYIHAAYHDAIDACLNERADQEITIVAIHSFTPIYLGKSRPWQIGIVFADDRRVADRLLQGLKGDSNLTVGANEPYSPADEVYYTVARHARPRGLPAAMIEIRNDEIGDEAGEQRWADRLTSLFAKAPASVRFESCM